MLANEEINAAKSSLYPRLSLSANSEYSKKYANTRNNYINDESLVSSTGHASSVSLKLNYELYKFGANALNIDAAAYKKQSLSYKECVTLNEAKLRLLELYYNLRYYVANTPKNLDQIQTNFSLLQNMLGLFNANDAICTSIELIKLNFCAHIVQEQ